MNPRDPGDSLRGEHISSAVDKVLQCFQDGKYAALIGSRYSGKTEVLQGVLTHLRQDPNLISVYLNLYEVDSSRKTAFLTGLYRNIIKNIFQTGQNNTRLPQ